MDKKFIGRIKYSIKELDEFELSFDVPKEHSSLDQLCRYLDEGRSGFLIAESGRGRTYTANCVSNKRNSLDNKKAVVFSLADYEVGKDLAYLLPLVDRIESLQENDQVIVILDGYESLVSRNISLSSVLSTFRNYFQSEELPILLTCLPIDYLIKKPKRYFCGSLELFEAEMQPMNSDEFEEFIRFEKSCKKNWFPYSYEEYLKLVSWLEDQGLLDLCRKPGDLLWLLEFKKRHDSSTISSRFVSLSAALENKISYELEYAKQAYGDFGLNHAKSTLEELAVITTLSSQKRIELAIYQYHLSLNDESLLIILRSGLFHLYDDGWSGYSVSLSWQLNDWLISKFLERKLGQGMAKNTLVQHLLVQVGERKVLHHGLSGASLFLTGNKKHKDLLGLLVKGWPEAVVDRGDPSVLGEEFRRQVLVNARALFQGKSFQFGYESGGIKRFVTPSIESFVAESINDVLQSDHGIQEEKEYLRLLSNIIQHSQMRSQIGQVLRIVEGIPRSDSNLWQDCISCVAQVGSRDQRNNLKQFLAPPLVDSEINHDEVLSYASRLFYIGRQIILNEMSLSEFLAYLHPLVGIQTNESPSGLGTLIENDIWGKLSQDEKNSLIDGLKSLLFSEGEGNLNEDYRWIAEVLGSITKKYFTEYKNSQPEIAITVVEKLLSSERLFGIGPLDTVISIALRDLLALQVVETLLLLRRHIANADLNYFQLISPLSRLLLPSSVGLSILSGNMFSNEVRLSAVPHFGEAELRSISDVENYPEEIREAIELRVSSLTRTQEMRRRTESAHDQQALEERQTQQDIGIHRINQWIDGMRAGDSDCFGELQRLVLLGQSMDRPFYFPYSEITDRYNEEIAEAAKQGIIAVLENYQLPCQPFTSHNDDRVAAGFILQAVELEKEVINRFHGQKLINASAALTWSLTELPSWSDRLIRYHESVVRNVLFEVIESEAEMQEVGASRARSLHELLAEGRGGGKLFKLCWPTIKDCLQRNRYSSVKNLSIASLLAVQNNDGEVARENLVATIEVCPRDHLLLVCYLCISPDDALQELERFLEESFEENHHLVIRVFAELSKNSTQRHLDRVWQSTRLLVRFLKLLIRLVPENHEQMPEGIYTVTPQHDVSNLYKKIVSISMEKLTYDQGKQLTSELRADEVLRSQWWIDYLEQAILDRESSQSLEVDEVKAWLEGNWVASIKTVGQLHAYVSELLKDIETHLQDDDFSIKLLWRGLQQGKITKRMTDGTKELRKDDRTEEEYVQVWLADELLRRSANNLIIKREDQNNEAKRRDISISIPGVGSCVIEIKVVNWGRDSVTYNKLRVTLSEQVPMYVRDEGHKAAILFLFKSDKKKYELPNNKQTENLRDLSDALNKEIPDIREGNEHLRSLEALSVFGLQVASR